MHGSLKWLALIYMLRTQTFKKRAAEIADHAHNVRGALGEGADFLRGLDEMERQCMIGLPSVRNIKADRDILVFRAVHDGAKAMRVWMGELKKS